MNKSVTKKFDFNFKVVDVKDASGEVIVEGYANTSSKDRVGDIVLPKAFETSLETYLKNPVLLLNHDWNDVIGRTIHAEITDKGLFIKARISDTRSDIKTLIREKCYSTFSIGYNEIDSDYDDSTKTKYIKALELLEISIVSVPANTEAMFTEIAEKAEVEKPAKQADGNKIAVKTAGDLKTLIKNVKEVIGKSFDDECLHAVIDYFNLNEENMTKDQLINLLKVKTLPEQSEQSDQAKQDQPQVDMGEALKQMAAKLDMVAQALAQVMEKLDKPSQEEPKQEEQSAQEEPKQEEQAKQEDAVQEAQKQCEGCQDENCEECGAEHESEESMEEESAEEEQKELSEADIEKELADLSAQITALDEVVNG